MKPHLFFDVFIEDSMPGLFKGGDRTRFLTESNIRNKSEVYKYRSKYEITKYTLESYSLLPWTSEIIRIECENPAQKVITNEIKQFFPKAKILNERSNTSAKYINALNSSGIPDDDWVFFSPNNDHPFIGYELDFIQNFYDDVDNDSKSIPDGLTSIYFSHFSETVNIGAGHAVSTKSVAEWIVSKIGSNSVVESRAIEDYVGNITMDISSARHHLFWQPVKEWKVGLAQLLESATD